MAGQFALVRFHARRDRRLLFGLFAQDGFADDAFDIGVGELHIDHETGLKPLQAGHGVQGRLAGAHEQQAAAQIGTAMLGDLLNVVGALDFVADRLLDFIYDEQRAGKLAFISENLLYHIESIKDGGCVVVLKLIADGCLGMSGRGVLGFGADQRLGKLQAEDFKGQQAILLLERGFDLGFQPRERSQRMNLACARFSGSPAARSTSWMKARRTLSMEPAPSVSAAARKPPSGRLRLLSLVSRSVISAGSVTSERAVAPSAKWVSSHR